MNRIQEKTILVVDDDNLIRNSASLALSLEYKVLQAENGQKGLQVFQSHPIDLIISDYNMPEMNGLEMIKQLRTIETHPTPVYLFSTENSLELKSQAKQLGVLGWIVKPFDYSKLLILVNRTLAKEMGQ